MSGSTVFALTIFYQKIIEINKLHKLVRGKHTLEDIVFYKNTFLVGSEIMW